MKFLPLDHSFSIETMIPLKEVLSILKNRIDTYSRRNPNNYFTGEFDRHGFKIKKKLFLGDITYPVFYGRFKEKEGGVDIAVEASNTLLTFSILIGWLVWIFILVNTIKDVIAGDVSSLRVFVPAVIVLPIPALGGSNLYDYRVNKGKRKLYSFFSDPAKGCK